MARTEGRNAALRRTGGSTSAQVHKSTRKKGEIAAQN